MPAMRPPTSLSNSSPTRCPTESLTTLNRSRSRNNTAKRRARIASESDQCLTQAFEQEIAIRQAGQRVVQGLVLELALHALAHRDVFAQLAVGGRQFAGAFDHALLEFGVGLFQRLAVAFAFQCVGDVVGNECEQFLVARRVTVFVGMALHRQHADRTLVADQRYAEPATRPRADRLRLAAGIDALQARTIGEQHISGTQDVFGQAVAELARMALHVAFVNRVRKGQEGVIVGEQGDVEIAGVQQSADGAMYRRIEVFQALRAVGQLGNAEQRRLQALTALALQHLLLQQPVRIAQRVGTLGNAALKLLVHEAALQGRLDMLGNVSEHSLVALGVARTLGITLHNDTTDGLAAAQQRHAQPVNAVGSVTGQGPAHLRFKLCDGPAQRGTALEQVPGDAVLAFLHRELVVRIWRVVVGNVHEVREAEIFPGRVVQHDVEIFRIHQTADNAVQGAEDFRHLAVGTGLVGDGEQGALQAFGLLKVRHRQAQVLGSAHFMQAQFHELQNAVKSGPLCGVGPQLRWQFAGQRRGNPALRAQRRGHADRGLALRCGGSQFNHLLSAVQGPQCQSLQCRRRRCRRRGGFGQAPAQLDIGRVQPVGQQPPGRGRHIRGCSRPQQVHQCGGGKFLTRSRHVRNAVLGTRRNGNLWHAWKQ